MYISKFLTFKKQPYPNQVNQTRQTYHQETWSPVNPEHRKEQNALQFHSIFQNSYSLILRGEELIHLTTPHVSTINTVHAGYITPCNSQSALTWLKDL